MHVTSRPFVCLHAALAVAFTASTAAAQSPAPPVSTSAPGVHAPVLEHVEVQAAAVSLRYKLNENSSSSVTANHLQSSGALKVRFSADRRRRFSLIAGAGTGSSFTSSWNNTGVGTGDAHHDDLFVKQLYASVAPVNAIELQAGGLYVVRGETTEITSYDNDGFVAGGRLALRSRQRLFFDEVSVTAGNIGSTTTANVFTRFKQMDAFDYRQALVVRKLGKRVATSLDYTRHHNAETVRHAIVVKSKAMRVIDSVRFEQYRRVTSRPDYGFGFQADKALSKALSFGGGYADIDRFHGGLNGDKYVTGRRLFASTSVAVGSTLTASAYVTRAIANDFAVSNRTRLDLLLSYNVLRAVSRNK